MASSARIPTRNQADLLAALMHLQWLDGTDEAIGYHTPAVVKVVHEHGDQDKPARVGALIVTLNACVRHEWVRVRIDKARDRKGGANLAWSLQPAGVEAFRRAESASASTQEEHVDATTTAPPKSSAPWEEPAADKTSAEAAQALADLDAGEGDEGAAGAGEGEEETVDPDDVTVENGDDPSEEEQTPVNEGSNQLTLAIGGPKPKSSILKIMAKQQKYGSTRQFKNLERIPFSGYLEVRGVAIDVQANGFVQRMQKAVISELVIDGVDVSDNDD